MVAALIGGFLDVVIETLPAIEQTLGRAAFVVEAERLLHVLGNAQIAVSTYRNQLQQLMQANDAAVDAAAKKDPQPGGGNG